MRTLPLLSISLVTPAFAAFNQSATSRVRVDYTLEAFAPPDKCPPCFNCLLPAFPCGQFANCSQQTSHCVCPQGWGNVDCFTPLCGSLKSKDRPLRQEGKDCACEDGWGGVNCNVCHTDAACAGFPIRDLPPGQDPVQNMTCYRNGPTVINNHYQCDVTNRQILEQLKEKKPEVTFSCQNHTGTCEFQFWIARDESFYCSLDSCRSVLEPGPSFNTTRYDCDHIKCKCVPGKMLCGAPDSINLDDFLEQEIKGPAGFSCRSDAGCNFVEPAMNDLILSVFGDTSITLSCGGGECLHVSQLPGYTPAPRKSYGFATLWVSAGGIGGVFLAAVLVFWLVGRVDNRRGIKLPESEAAKLVADHVPASLHFSSISYRLGDRTILDSVTGSVKSGQVMAVIGASGAGKSTFLDLLARKRKTGEVSGTMLVNGRAVPDSTFKRVVGFVDQEDTLMSTLTVYETVFYSALLRLPRDMSAEAKQFRTLETMNELGILHLRDVMIGESGRRSISGGEKRRVSIACELVTSPSILFLDEPTSGLDAYNAFNVVESLVRLARDYKRTIVLTIHQPRSNIVALFDQLLVLARGKTVYSGPMEKCHSYFADIGHPCPPGYNIADYLIDLTMDEEASANADSERPSALASVTDNSNVPDEERGFNLPRALRSSTSPVPDETELRTRGTSSNANNTASNFFKNNTSRLLEAVSPTKSASHVDRPLNPKVATLVEAYSASIIATSLRREIDELSNPRSAAGALPDVVVEAELLRGRRRASWATQFRILGGRAFKNLYRNPALLVAHYVSAVLIAVICGLLYYQVPNSIDGFQNRLGLLFFTLALFGFSCLSSLALFANERLLFTRERANGYYSTFTYFSSKLLLDVVPLRVVPPLVYGGIIYGLVGLVPSVSIFWKFLLALVLFNLAAASMILLLAVAFADTRVGSLVGTLIMLFNILFAGLFLNRETVPWAFRWLFTVSFFHAAFEALAVNELRYLRVIDHKYGVDLEVPAAAVLNLFGLRAQSYWTNTAILCGFFFGLTALSFVVLHVFVREKR